MSLISDARAKEVVLENGVGNLDEGVLKLKNAIDGVLKKNGLEGQSSVTTTEWQGRQVVMVDINEADKKALENDPTLRERVKNGMMTYCAVDACGGICFGLLIACIVTGIFAIPGGICLGLGYSMLNDNDPSNDIEGEKLVLAGKVTLGIGGAGGGLAGMILACIIGWGVFSPE